MIVLLLEMLVSLLLIESTHVIELRGFDNCRELFYAKSPPVLEYKTYKDVKCICENYKNSNYFAAYYDTNKKLPLFSAFTLPEIIWKERKNGNTYKTRKWRSSKQLNVGEQIPRINDYKGIGAVNLDRGHLAPRSYFPTTDGRKAVDVLTNIALQDKTFNQNTWVYLEKRTLDISQKHCQNYGGQTFFITGVVPSDDRHYESEQNQSMKINIPSFFWTVVCCDTSRVDIRDTLKGWSYAYISANNNTSTTFDIMTVEEFLKDKRIGLKYEHVALFENRIVMTHTRNLVRVKNCLFDPKKANEIIEAIRKNKVLKPVRTGSVPLRPPPWIWRSFFTKYYWSNPFEKRSSNFKTN